MFYLVYKVTNLVNGKFYIGAHKTDNKDDDYMGSGTYIKRAIKKYGIENFKKEILVECTSSEEMYRIESELVVLCEDSYNLKFGGDGGWDYSAKILEDIKIKREKTLKEKYGDEWKKILAKLMRSKVTSEGLSKAGKHRFNTNSQYRCTILKNIENMSSSPAIKAKRIETFKRIEHQKGEKNSQYGTCWISHELVGSKKCNIDLLPEYIEQGWIKGRNVKF